MLCHGLEIKFVHFGLFKIFGKGNPFAYGLQEALWCVDDCGRLRTSNVLPLTVFSLCGCSPEGMMKQILRFCPAEPLIQTNRAFVRYEHFVEHFFLLQIAVFLRVIFLWEKMPNAKWNT